MVKGGRGSKKKQKSKSSRAGLTFPVARMGRGLRNMRLATHEHTEARGSPLDGACLEGFT